MLSYDLTEQYLKFLLNQAFTYLKSRLKGLGPMFVFVNLFVFVTMRIWLKTPIRDLLDAFFESLI